MDIGRMNKRISVYGYVDEMNELKQSRKVLKKIKCAYGLNEVLSYYRRTNESLSANKLTALKRTWNL